MGMEKQAVNRRRDTSAFKNRFSLYKQGIPVYDRGRIIPYEDRDYDYAKANELGYTPDETGHMPTRDYKTGAYLKSITHPTLMKSIVSDLGEGYIPVYNEQDGHMYSHRFPDDLPVREESKIPEYADGKLTWYDQDEDLYYGGSLSEVTVTGEKRNHSAIDYLLWKADRAGLPSHVTNAARDLNNRVQNLPIIAGDAVARYIKGGYDNLLQAYKDADVNPSKVARKLLVYPYTNDENNYSKDELSAMRKLSDISGKGTGAIGYDAYRRVNRGRYAGDINLKNFNNPYKVAEWSLG